MTRSCSTLSASSGSSGLTMFASMAWFTCNITSVRSLKLWLTETKQKDKRQEGGYLSVLACAVHDEDCLVEGSQVLLELHERVESILACNLVKVRNAEQG